MQFENCPKVTAKQDIGLVCSVKDVSSLFRDLLRIPPRQRPYEFTQEEMEKLLNDLFTAWNKWTVTKPQSYLLGGILLKKKTDLISDRLDIIDGQQRLTTICIIIAAIRRFMKDKRLLTEFLKGREEKDLDVIELGNDLNNTFFQNFIINGELDAEYISSTGNFIDVDKIVADLKWNNLVNSISSKNMARNYLICVNFIERHLQGSESKISNLYTFMKFGCSFIVTQIKDRDEWSIFDAINTKGRELHSMDLLKGFFIDKLECEEEEKEKLTVQWMKIYQGIGAVEFSILIYAINLHLNTPTEMTLPGSEELKNTIETLANDNFIDSYLSPLHVAFQAIIDPSTGHKSIRREIEKFKFLIKTHLSLPTEQNSFILSTMIMTLLIAIFNAKHSNQKLFNQNCNDISSDVIVFLIKSWNKYMINLVISEKKNVECWAISLVLKNILKGKLMPGKKLFEPPCIAPYQVRKLLTRQHDQQHIYTVCFKLIKFDEKPIDKAERIECFSEMDHLEAHEIHSKKPVSTKLKGNRWKQIGNYALKKLGEDDMKEFNTTILELPENDETSILKRTNLLIDYITEMACNTNPTEIKNDEDSEESDYVEVDREEFVIEEDNDTPLEASIDDSNKRIRSKIQTFSKKKDPSTEARPPKKKKKNISQ